MKTVLDTNIFTIANVLTPAECAALIERGESLGFEAATVRLPKGPQMLPNVRNNDRVIFEDSALALDLWDRVRAFVPAEIDGCRVTGLFPQWRYYRYDPGQRFKRHPDGSVETPGNRSRLTFLLYLNTDYTDGETVFSDYERVNGERITHEIRVTPEVGLGLFFAHERKHEGSAVTTGRKYVLRTDVLYATP